MRVTKILLCTLAALTLVGPARVAHAQAAPAGPGAGNTEDIGALLDAVNDIDKLRVLAPLALKPDQLDKIVPVLQQSQKDYTKQLDETIAGPIKAMAAEIKSVRQKVLEGKSIPSDFDTRMKRNQADLAAKRKKLDDSTLSSLSTSLQGILTATQIKKAAQLARDTVTASAEEGTPAPRGTDTQFFNLYVLSTFMGYPRMVPLLQDMRKAADTTATAAPAPSAPTPAGQ